MQGNKVENHKILLIDDDETLTNLLGDHLRVAGYHCLMASTSVSGLRLVTEEQPDLIVLDVMMPDLDGWEVCRRLRENTTIPIIMLTAKGDEFDKLRGFRLGVDDYVTKPFSFAELTARIGAVLGRTQHVGQDGRQIHSADLIIDFDKQRVSVGGSRVDLTPTEFRLLEVLASNAYRTVPIEQLLDEVWGPGYDGQVDQVKHYVWSLRKKIERDPGDPAHIITARGFGYRFE